MLLGVRNSTVLFPRFEASPACPYITIALKIGWVRSIGGMILTGEIKYTDRNCHSATWLTTDRTRTGLGSTPDMAVLRKLFSFLFPAARPAQNNRWHDATNPKLAPNSYGSRNSWSIMYEPCYSFLFRSENSFPVLVFIYTFNLQMLNLLAQDCLNFSTFCI